MTRRDKICWALCSMSMVLGTIKGHVDAAIGAWFYLPWSLGALYFFWVAFNETDWKLWKYRWQMRKLGYGWGRDHFSCVVKGSKDASVYQISRDKYGLWYPRVLYEVPMPVEGGLWELGYGLPDPVSAHVAACLEIWGGTPKTSARWENISGLPPFKRW